MRKFTPIIIFSLLFSCGTEKTEQRVNEPITLSVTDLQDKSLDELRMVRNEIFARRGYKFKSIELQKHFSTFEWYKQQYEKVDSLLSELDSKNVQLVLEVEKKKKAKLERRIIRISSSDLAKYQNAYDSAEKWDKQFISKMFKTINQFKNRVADTTLLTIGNIDGIGKLDTVNTQIYVLDDTIHVESKWTRNGELMWRDNSISPYLQINNEDIFAYDTRHPWVTFTIAVNYGAPELSERTDYPGIHRKTALKMANWYIENKNLSISETAYIQYFDSFKGQLFMYGEPEIRHGLFQWYEPKKQFIPYYQQ